VCCTDVTLSSDPFLLASVAVVSQDGVGIAGHWGALHWYGTCFKQGVLHRIFCRPVIQCLSAVLLCGALALHIWATETLGKVYILKSTAYAAIIDVLQDNVSAGYSLGSAWRSHWYLHNTSVQHIVAPELTELCKMTCRHTIVWWCLTSL